MLSYLFWAVVYGTGLHWLYQKLAPRRLILLGYHSVSDSGNARILQNDLYAHLSVPAPLFAREMRFLQETGYQFLKLADLQAIQRGERKLPKKAVLVCFDDGYRDNFLNAYPILKRLRIPAVIFLVVD